MSLTWIILSADSEWQDLFESSNTFIRITPNEITGDQLIKERDEGKYGCEVSNGINPSLWSEFMIKISGKMIHFGKAKGAFEFIISVKLYFETVNLDSIKCVNNKYYIYSDHTGCSKIKFGSLKIRIKSAK